MAYSRSGEGIDPSHARKAPEIGVGTADGQAVLDRERREVGIGNHVPGGMDAVQEPPENDNMIRSRLWNPHPRMLQPLRHLPPGGTNRKRPSKDPRIRREPKKGQRRLPWDADSAWRIQFVLQPLPRAGVLRHIDELRIEQQVGGYENHLYATPSTSAISSATLSRSVRNGSPLTGLSE